MDRTTGVGRSEAEAGGTGVARPADEMRSGGIIESPLYELRKT